MGEGIKQMFHVQKLSPASPLEDRDNKLSSSDSEDDDDVESIASSSSDAEEDSGSPSDGPLCDLPSLMAHLPVRRGLSKFYQGKSQSYTSLASVRSVEDLAKKEIPYKRKMKSCRSYAGGLDGTIAKKTSSSSSSSFRVSAMRSCSSDVFAGSKPPLPVPAHKNQ